MHNSGEIVSFDLRLHSWLGMLEAAQPCHSQKDAHELIMSLWVQANIEGGACEELIQEIRKRRLCKEHGWEGLDADVAFANIEKDSQVRVYLHLDGSIVVQSTEENALHILGALPATRQDQLVDVKEGKSNMPVRI